MTLPGTPPNLLMEDPAAGTLPDLLGELLLELPLGVPLQRVLPGFRRLSESWEPVKQGPAHGGRGSTGKVGAVLLPPRESEEKLPAALVDKDYVSGKLTKNGKKRKLRGPNRKRWDQGALTTMLKKALSADDGYWARRVINGLIVKASRGNPGAQRILWDRCEGVLKEKIEHSGEVKLQKSVMLTDMRDRPEMPVFEIQGEVNGSP